MRFLTIEKILLLATVLCITNSKLIAQEKKLTVHQNPKFEQLLEEKRKINASIPVNGCYKIQIFSGNSEKAKNALNDSKQNFKDLDGTIVFNTPNYKVWIGNFRSRIEAERNLVDVKKVYQNAFLIKPQK